MTYCQFSWEPIQTRPGTLFRIFAGNTPIAKAQKVHSGWRITRRGHPLESMLVRGDMRNVELLLHAWWRDVLRPSKPHKKK